jgi:small neutral amino acid transporter SnatA (MarC family)
MKYRLIFVHILVFVCIVLATFAAYTAVLYSSPIPQLGGYPPEIKARLAALLTAFLGCSFWMYGILSDCDNNQNNNNDA